MRSTPTIRQGACLLAIHAFAEAHGYPPSIADVSRALGFRVPGGALSSFLALRKKGYLTSERGIGRSHVLTELGKAWLTRRAGVAAPVGPRSEAGARPADG